MLPPVAPVLAKYLAIALLSNAALPRSTFSTHGTFPNGFFSFKYAALLFVVPITHSACSSVSSVTPQSRRRRDSMRPRRASVQFEPIAPKFRHGSRAITVVPSRARRVRGRRSRTFAFECVRFASVRRARTIGVRDARGSDASSPTRRGGRLSPYPRKKT